MANPFFLFVCLFFRLYFENLLIYLCGRKGFFHYCHNIRLIGVLLLVFGHLLRRLGIFHSCFGDIEVFLDFLYSFYRKPQVLCVIFNAICGFGANSFQSYRQCNLKGSCHWVTILGFWERKSLMIRRWRCRPGGCGGQRTPRKRTRQG